MKKLISLILALMTLLSVAVFSTGAAETSDHYYLSLLRRQPISVDNGYAYTFYCDTFDSVAYDNFSEVETELTDILSSALGATESVAEAYINGYITDLFIPEIKIG